VKYFLTILALFLAVSANVLAEEWNCFRGSECGVSKASGLPVNWDAKAGKGVAWKLELPGKGISSPVIVGDRVFLTAAVGYLEKRLIVLAVDVKTGKTHWKRQFAATGSTACHPTTSMAGPTPVADAQGIYALFATGDMAAFTLDGDLKWYRSLVTDHPTVGNQVGMASSLAMGGGHVVVQMENVGESFIAGIDPGTGAEKWRIKRESSSTWNSPLNVKVNGKDRIVVQNGKGLSLIDPANGKEIWNHKASLVPIASPALLDGTLFACGSPFVAMPLDDKPGKILWESPRMGSRHASPLAVDGRVYGVVQIGLNCLDAKTGKEIWQQRLKGPISACPVAADGKIYLFAEDGSGFVVKQGGEKPELLATNPLGESISATPALLPGKLLVRGDKHLWCLTQP
jgi:outer membrane protein assembly factor BamB